MTKHVYAAVIAVLLLASGITMAMVDYNTENDANAYDVVMCVANYRNYCVDQVCQVSERRDCQDLCMRGAAAKCQQENDHDGDYGNHNSY